MSASCVTRKRARTEEQPEEDLSHLEMKQGESTDMDAVAAAFLIRDAEFWLDDGTVILVAGDVEFRVYSGLLAAHSPVLKELFSKTHFTRLLPLNGQGQISCPVVHLSDSPDDLRHLLCAYMPQDAASMYDQGVPAFDAVSAAIRLGHKYQIASLYDRSLEFLKENYTNDFDKFDRHGDWMPAGWKTEEAIGVVNLARLIGEPTLLPVAFLSCTTLGEQIVRGYERPNGTQEHLTIDDQALCIKAKMAIRKARVASLFNTLSPSPAKTCKKVADCRAALRKAVYSLHSTIDDWLDDTDDPFDTYKKYIKGSKLNVCDVCEPMVDTRAQSERRKLWNRLPVLLGIQVAGWNPPAPADEPAPVQQ